MNNNIFPCFLHNGNAKESADFYCKVFNGRITIDTGVVINIELFGQKFMLLNGPEVEKNASISFLVNTESEDEVQKYWDQLIDGGNILMPLNSYPWSKKYGWVEDKFGISWQIYLGEMQVEQKVVPTFMFMNKNNGKALNAMEFYTQVFPNSRIGNILRYEEGDETNESPENIQHASFVINNYHLSCMDSSRDYLYNFNQGVSMVVMTKDQEETDYYWESLTADGGNEEICGWLKDKYGLSWQIFPQTSSDLISGSDKEKVQKVLEAIGKMKKIIIKDLEEAYNS